MQAHVAVKHRSNLAQAGGDFEEVSDAAGELWRLKGRPIARQLGFGASPHQVHLVDGDDN
jgi:hypothetical protein